MISAGCLFCMSMVCAGMLACRFNNATENIRYYGHLSTVIYFFSSMLCCWTFSYIQDLSIKILSAVLMSIPLIMLVYMFMTQSHQLQPLSASSNIKSFVCPLMPIIPCLAMAANNYVFVSICWNQIMLFVAWACIGVSIYLGYGLHHSKLGQEIEAVKSFGKF